MNNSKKFKLGVILSVIKDGLSSYDDFGDVYEILNFMAGESLATPQLIRVAAEAEPYLIQQHPWLLDAYNFVKSHANYTEILPKLVKELEKKYGKTHSVTPIPMDDHEIVDPGEDARRLGFKGEIIDIDFSDEDDNEISPYGDINW